MTRRLVGVQTCPVNSVIDLRSDTVTKPTQAMREVIAGAEVGDDVFGDDPTVQRLEERTAEVLGKEAAMFVPSGTMANQVAIRSHTEPGQEIVMDGNAHIYYYEAGGTAALSGVICRCLNSPRGQFSANDVHDVLRPSDVHFASTRLVCVENTHNRGGGSVWTLGQIHDVTHAAREHGLKLHLDGARIWNAAAATGASEKQIAAEFDSVSVCFSKGLGAPVGSALAGSRDFVQRARRFRKQFGGGMRQSGMMAAGALFALEHHRKRLQDDHRNAQALATGLHGTEGIQIDPALVETNIVMFQVTAMPAAELAAKLAAAGIHVLAIGPGRIRAVTHLMISGDDIEHSVRTIRSIIEHSLLRDPPVPN